MGLTPYPNGVSSFGIPVLPGIPGVFTGAVFFVCSVNGSNNNTGKSKAQPLATVDYAIGLCTADAGDLIIVMPGHAETVTATSIALDVAGVTILGIGNGLKRPTFTFGAAAATITVTGANCKWTGCHFKANFADVAAAFTIGAAKDFDLSGNTFLDISASLNFLSIVVTGATNNAADGLTVRDNWYMGLVVTANAFVSVLGNLDRLTVTGNHVDKAATNNAGQFVTVAAKVILGARIERNTLIVVGATGTTVGIFLTGSSTTNTGIVAQNFVASLDTTAELIATAGTGLRFFENYYTGTADASAKLWPVVDAA
jgi:hypothetical protein